MQGHIIFALSACLLCAIRLSHAAPAYCTSTGPRCITAADSSCRPNGVALPDGDYQACEGCTFYHSCVAGQINYAFRSCAATNEGGINGLLVWDDNLKRCEYQSNTCRQCYNGGNGGGICTSTGPSCITSSPSSCRGLPDGDYQACEGCTFYHSCVAQQLNYAFRDCPLTNQGGLNGKLVWDDTLKRCEYQSTTCRDCHNRGIGSGSSISVRGDGSGDGSIDGYGGSGFCPSTGAGCITASPSSCRNLADGDYQACEGCTFFHSCVAQQLNYAFRDCPLTNQGGLNGKLVWDNRLKRCEYQSSTCRQCGDNGSGGVCSSTGSRCISASANSCRNRVDGDYQACEGCTFYHSCVAGYINYAYRECPLTNQGGINGKLVWDDSLKRCEYRSTTCVQCAALAGDPHVGELLESLAAAEKPAEDELEIQAIAVPEQSSSCRTSATCVDPLPDACRRGTGDYQDCRSCSVYHSCSGGVLHAGRRCAPGLFWNQDTPSSGHCDWISATCRPCK